MSKKNKTSDRAGTYALCITIGLIIGVGLGPAFGGLTISVPLSIVIGIVAGYVLTNRKITKKKRH